MAKEYIEREALLNELGEELKFNTPMYNKEQNEFVNRGIKIAIRDIRKQPTADVQEGRHAHWEYFFDIEEMARCSNCYEVLKKGRASCYCPHCGAKMDKESEQE